MVPGDGVEVDGALVAEVVEQVVGALGLLPALLVPENLKEFKCSVLFHSVFLPVSWYNLPGVADTCSEGFVANFL